MAVTERATERDQAAAAVGAVRAVHAAVAEATGVRLPLRLWDGREIGGDGPFRIVLHHPWSLRAALLPPSDLAAAEAYVLGAIDLEGDIVAALDAGQAAATGLSPADRARLARWLLRLPRPPRLATARRAHLQGRRHSLSRDRAAIAFHYDLPEGFYRTFLDRDLVYSCGYFAAPETPLDDAQHAKLDLICRKLRLRPGQRLLDVGCGWGSLLLHAARHYGVEGVGVTLSRTQHDAGRRRVEEAGFAGRVDIRLVDYRELDGTFDAVASVGMVEHVGHEHLSEYFDTVFRLTRPGGLFLNHGIVTGEAERVRKSRRRDFIGTYVFPDGSLVPAWRMLRHLQQAGFEALDVEQLRRHYALTLRRWVRNLERNRDAAVQVTSEIDYRVWRLFMAGSAGRFEARGLGVVQILGARPGPDADALPLTRAEHLEAAPAVPVDPAPAGT